jgi:PAS domain S-box-containing protein
LLPAYAFGAAFAALQMTTSWLHGTPTMTPMGWGFEAGPGHRWFLVFTFACVIPAIAILIGRVRQSDAPAERDQVRIVTLGIAAPFVLAGLTSGFLPLFGIQLPRLGSVSFALLGLSVAYSYYRYGFSALAPATFSREILSTMPDGLALVGPAGRVLSGNERMAQLLGIRHVELVDYPIGNTLSGSVLEPPRELREVECRLCSRVGEEIPVSVSTSRLFAKSGLEIGVVAVVRDLRELVALRSRLVTSGRLAAVGELAAGIAHEINNPIAFVRANLSQLQQSWAAIAKRLPTGSAMGPDGVDLIGEGEELLEECIEGVERTVRIVQDVKGFAHAGSDEHESVDLNLLLERVLRVVQPQVDYGVSVESDFGDLPPVFGTAAQLQQVFLNLVLNAVQAIEGEGSVVVSTWSEGSVVAASVSDDGPGIPVDNRERIFDPFFTTKPVGEGTGLGLAISYQILERHGADLALESTPGAGTTFTVRLPIALGSQEREGQG